MNSEQITSLARQVLLAVGGFVVGKGWVDNETMLALAGAISVLVGSVWALYSRRRDGLIQAAAAQPEVARVVTTPAIANSMPNNQKVVSP